MLKHSDAEDFVEHLSRALAVADKKEFEGEPERYRMLARAALREFGKPSSAMISAAYEAVRFDEHWAINTGRDFEKAVKAMVGVALSKEPPHSGNQQKT